MFVGQRGRLGRLRSAQRSLGLLLVLAPSGCREVTADGFPASAELACPSGFELSNGRCYRMPPPPGPAGAPGPGSARDGGASAEAGSIPSGSQDARPGALTPDAAPGARDASAGVAPEGGSTGPTPALPPTPGPPATPPPDPDAMEGSSVAVEVAAGFNHDCALMNDGTVRCWGQNNEGQTGRPKSISRQQSALTVPGLRDVVDIAAGREHTCAVTAKGAVLCWGTNGNGQFGNGTFVSKWYPDPATPALGIDAAGPIWISPSGPRTCAIARNGSLSCWGGSLPAGGDWNRPMPFGGLTQVTAVALGDHHSCALVPPGSVTCWAEEGADRGGVYGPPVVPVPQSTGGLAGVSVGFSQTCVFTTAGRLECSPAIELLDAPITDARALSSGYGHACVLRSSSTVWCWGGSSRNVLGREAEATGPVIDLAGVTALSAGRDHTCVVVARGLVRCWGTNYGSTLPDAPVEPPLAIPGTGDL